jgi:hypothetical protein
VRADGRRVRLGSHRNLSVSFVDVHPALAVRVTSGHIAPMRPIENLPCHQGGPFVVTPVADLRGRSTVAGHDLCRAATRARRMTRCELRPSGVSHIRCRPSWVMGLLDGEAHLPHHAEGLRARVEEKERLQQGEWPLSRQGSEVMRARGLPKFSRPALGAGPVPDWDKVGVEELTC